MLLWFNKNGVLKEQLNYGATARVGTQNFKIFVYFDTSNDTDYTEVYGAAAIKFQRPDLENTEYPTLMMTKAKITFDKDMTEDGDNYSGLFEDGTKYTGYVFDFSKIKDTSLNSIVTMLDTPGLWKATVSLISGDSETAVNNVVGLFTFNVEGSVSDSDEDITELSYDVITDNLISFMETKLYKDSIVYMRFHKDFVTAATEGTLVKAVYIENAFVFDQTTKSIYKINSVTENESDTNYVYATYTLISDFNVLDVYTIPITATYDENYTIAEFIEERKGLSSISFVKDSERMYTISLLKDENLDNYYTISRSSFILNGSDTESNYGYVISGYLNDIGSVKLFSTTDNLWTKKQYLTSDDIIDGLDSEDANKPLSANQGRILKELIDTGDIIKFATELQIKSLFEDD